MFRAKQMGQTGGIGTVTATWHGGSRTRAFVRQIGEIPSAVRRRARSRARNGAWCSWRRDRRADHDQAAFRDKLDCLQYHGTRQYGARSAPTDTDAIPETIGSFHSLSVCSLRYSIYALFLQASFLTAELYTNIIMLFFFNFWRV